METIFQNIRTILPEFQELSVKHHSEVFVWIMGGENPGVSESNMIHTWVTADATINL